MKRHLWPILIAGSAVLGCQSSSAETVEDSPGAPSVAQVAELPAGNLTVGVVVDCAEMGSDRCVGGSAFGGERWAAIVELAARQVRHALTASQTYANLTLVYELRDSESTPDVASAHAIDLVRNEHAKVLVVDNSRDDTALLQMSYDKDAAKHLDVPVFCTLCFLPSINDPAVEEPDPLSQVAHRDAEGWNHTVAMSALLQAPALVRAALRERPEGDWNQDGRFKIAHVAGDDTLGHGMTDAVQQAAEALRPGALFEGLYLPSKLPEGYDWQPVLDELVDGAPDAKPDVVIESTTTSYAPLVAKAYAEAGDPTPILHTSTLRAESLWTLGELAEGQVGVSFETVADDASGAAFTADLAKASGGDEIAFADSMFYDSLILTALATVQAIQRSAVDDPEGVTGAQIREAIPTLQDPAGEPVGAGEAGIARAMTLIAAGLPINYQGASGPCDLDANRRARQRIVRWRAEGGQFVDLERYDCVADDTCPEVR